MFISVENEWDLFNILQVYKCRNKLLKTHDDCFFAVFTHCAIISDSILRAAITDSGSAGLDPL